MTKATPNLYRPFNSFWIGGFEGADHVNGHGQSLDPNGRNRHATRFREDYAALSAVGIRTVRESIGWRLLESRGLRAWIDLENQARAAADHGIQVIWSLMHYGWPQHLDPFKRPDAFVDAFATHCRRVAERLIGIGDPEPVWQPVNEISFLAWAASSTGLIFPHVNSGPENGYRLKRVFVRAALRAIDAIRAVAPAARFVHTDPLVHVEPPRGAGPETCHSAKTHNEYQFQAWDMLAGIQDPELGGAVHYLDIVGVNYYHSSQWEHVTGQRLEWHLGDRRRRHFTDLIQNIWHRYSRPICIAETGHIGEGRGQWLDDMAKETEMCLERQVPILGICLYPVLDRPDWQNPSRWHNSGLWDLPHAETGDFTRKVYEPYLDRFRYWQHVLPLLQESVLPNVSLQAPPILKNLNMTDLIVFSHLRWDFVYQRPQQLLSRLASCRSVTFVEEPIPGAAEARLETYEPCRGVTVLRMHLTSDGAGFHDNHMAAMKTMVQNYLKVKKITEFIIWFYTPMAQPLSESLNPRGMVYDCMDELVAFDFAPAELIAREKILFETVDLVFTGGRSLYESKRRHHKEVYCFPSSVDQAHFGQCDVPDHPDQAGLAQPRLGYYGVIDERIDLGIVAAMADAHPDWQLVLVGPFAKISQAAVPRRQNIHWLGQRRYDELPAFLSGWNVCLMPFAMNASTRFISPTKTLEYLAAGKPVVSTPVRDVVEQYSDVVPIATTHAEFVQACERVLAYSADDLARFRTKAAEVVGYTSWDRTALEMQQLLARFDGKDESDSSCLPGNFLPDTLRHDTSASV